MSFAFFFFAFNVFFNDMCNASQRKNKCKESIGQSFFRCDWEPVMPEDRVTGVGVGEGNEEN